MEPLTLYAPAKVNLTLTVGDRRPDGYHDVSTVMQAVGLYDTLILTHGGAGLTLTCTDPAVPADATNLVLRAAGKFFEETKLPVPDLHLHLRKRIPSQAGLGGGHSADISRRQRGGHGVGAGRLRRQVVQTAVHGGGGEALRRLDDDEPAIP